MAELTFKSTFDVDVVQQAGSDEVLARAAWVSTGKDLVAPDGKPITSEKVAGVLGYLIKNRHGTPFEHGSLTVRVDAPIKVWREWHRHRIGFSYNEISGRYVQLAPVFYVPPRDRPMIRPDHFKSSKPDFGLASDLEYGIIADSLKVGYVYTYGLYERMLEAGCDRGLARDVLGVGIYSACWVTCNPRSVMAFLELRQRVDDSKRPSRPLWEINQCANQLEAIFARFWPITHSLWLANGRMAP